MTSLTDKADNPRPADQISCDVGEVGEDEDTQHLQGLNASVSQRVAIMIAGVLKFL
jgi:hypothetical protein